MHSGASTELTFRKGRPLSVDAAAPSAVELAGAVTDQLREYLRNRRRDDLGPLPEPTGSDTVYFAVVDESGMAVSFINSLYDSFGSGRTTPKTGITLQNRGACFVTEPGHPNCIGPHKRCVHTLMPGMILRHGKPYAVLGLKGGHVQPQAQAQIICNLIDFGMAVQEAISAARFNHIDATKVALEPEFPQAVRDQLSRRGHRIVAGTPESFGGAHAIVIDPQSGAFVGGSDPRKGGCALGY